MEQRIIIVCVFILFLLSGGVNISAQIQLKSEYISASAYKDEKGNRIGGKGDLHTFEGSVKLPLSVKEDRNGKLTAWIVTLDGTYASMNNKEMPRYFTVKELMNAQLGMMHMRPLNEKWSVLAILGAGIYTADLNKVSGSSFLGQGGVLFIRHVNKNFDWGAGVALNNALGYPMIFPSLYMDWKIEGKYKFKLSMYNTFKAEIGTQFSKNFKLGILAESKGLMAAVGENGNNKYFVMQYGYIGIQPEFKIGKNFFIPIVGGIVASRETYFRSRTLKAFFSSKDDYPHFGVSPYFSIGIRYGLQ
ncbi:DUF6268 family outer membrane beta-barrel protein [Prevotella sp. OH937_COT-195]|uniref:DUF6268 family outer membrane beta-barrel protein n=1 Tax=Prevotella sp. OH937_COT-195 TaxID=2491051 RepID=UPI000F65073E|nr:DUF6268 family outer membrane beta-barrel protein [Prevotella sp. OH937_COT-195]RRD02657.1 hypothetical protein EII32_01175 [Prevotella sp. OH937_COT-195]